MAATLGSKTQTLKARRTQSTDSFWLAAAKRVVRQPLGLFGVSLTLMVTLVALLAPYLAPHDPFFQYQGQELVAPNSVYPLGTDEMGRDLLSRVMFGARISLSVGGASVVMGGLVGVLSGLLSGYWEGWVDAVTMRLWDSVLAFPPVLVGIAVAALLGPSTTNVAIALGIASIPQFARLTRASVLVEKHKEYVTAARCLGASNPRIVLRHIFPNTVSPLLVQLAVAMAFAVLLEAGLSFLGIGSQPPEASWGTMLSTARRFLVEAPWYGVFPGLALVVLLLGLNFVADAARTALDPHRRQY
ncbi:MAG: ABC transporter permease [Chloroflexi bacterium]|nr:ABC transporter permease [Chloroflexota bacterium]MCL5108057.1 ABC transporter permease [Chloroflexota bacterium]